MATKKLQDLAASINPNDSDIFIIEDATATKKITFANMFSKIKQKLGNALIESAEREKWNGYKNTLDELNRNLNSQVPKSASVISGNAVSLSGGYFEIGNIVIVSVFFQTNKAVTNDYLSMLSGFPIPSMTRAGMSVYAANSYNPHVQASIESTGFLRLSGTYVAGENIAVSGVYFK